MTTAYRSSPSPAPLTMSLSGFVVQVESDTGRVRWQAPIAEVSRLLRSGDRLFVCAEGRVHALDHDTGRHIGSATVGFRIRAAVCDGDRIVVACSTEVACVDRTGTLVWTVKAVTAGQSMLGPSEQVVVAHDHEQRELWHTPPCPVRFTSPGLLLGGELAQPDLD